MPHKLSWLDLFTRYIATWVIIPHEIVAIQYMPLGTIYLKSSGPHKSWAEYFYPDFLFLSVVFTFYFITNCAYSLRKRYLKMLYKVLLTHYWLCSIVSQCCTDIQTSRTISIKFYVRKKESVRDVIVDTLFLFLNKSSLFLNLYLKLSYYKITYEQFS